MSREDDFERGLVNRRAVLGEEWVQRSLDRATTFTADYQNLITRYAWHDIWSRPGLPHKARRMMVLAVTLSLGRWEEFELHVRAALTAKDDSRLSPDELKEVLLQNAIYAGVPAANTAFNLAQGILREVAGEIGYVLEPAEVRGRICLAAVRWSGAVKASMAQCRMPSRMRRKSVAAYRSRGWPRPLGCNPHKQFQSEFLPLIFCGHLSPLRPRSGLRWSHTPVSRTLIALSTSTLSLYCGTS